MRRIPTIILACGLVLALSMPSRAGGRINGPFVGKHQDYQRAVATVILNRMLNTRYRSESGGVALLALRLDRSGTVTKTTLARSSGSPDIDSLARATVPVGFAFPPFPEGMEAREIDITVPLRFGARP
ncbi:TonB family protein [Methylobacterium trifolii]|uniref:TonB C-terminal domain-containing protein n=1 Tax=Methylobacterium trifolii TaxID=1003092 RepID=A0ABQ4U4W1_9HYPH|nr:TonB family protein [Methylobacterium trifolii]GJE61872.1 hypothetical protein MPOCJGCO_3998 [Methylobacterium trifolii]